MTSGDPENASNTWPETTTTGFYSINVTDYCNTLGKKTFELTITDAEDATLYKTMKWEVTVINLSIITTFSENSVNTVGTSPSLAYSASGNIEKVVHFVLNGTEVGTVNLRANQTTAGPFSIPAQEVAGAYKLHLYVTASVNNRTIYSNDVYRDIIWYDSTSNDIIIASPYRALSDPPAETDYNDVTQYNTVSIPYTVAGGSSSSYTVQYYVDNVNVNTVTLSGTNGGTWNYIATASEGHILMIKVGDASIKIALNVSSLNIDIAPVTDNLVLDFNPMGVTNTSNKRMWSNDNYNMTVSNNFDWFNGGYGTDEDGDYFLIKAGTWAEFDYTMFKSYQYQVGDGVYETRSTVFRDGAELKVIFKTAAVRDANAVWFTNMGVTSESASAKSVGIQLNAHNGWLKTDSASNTEINGVAATNTYLYFPYSEEDKIELDININKDSEATFLMSYEDGCPSKAYPYTSSQALYHRTGYESPIHIGSPDCDVYIYRMKIYNTSLNTE
jgi:hypothetical protein